MLFVILINVIMVISHAEGGSKSKDTRPRKEKRTHPHTPGTRKKGAGPNTYT